MNLLKAALLLTHFTLYLLLLLMPWSFGEEILTEKKEDYLETFDARHKPSTEYEQYRRRIKKNIIEFSHLFYSELDKIQNPVSKYSPELEVRIATIILVGKEHRRAFQSDLEGLQMADGYEAWRQREAAELSELVQNRLIHLQNPKDCNLAPKTLAPLYVFEGFGYELHFLVYRFIIAYATERTMIVVSRGWLSDESGWEKHFPPFSDTCTDGNGSSFAEWPLTNKAQIVLLPAFSPLLPSAPFFPRTVPEDLAPRLQRLHGNPFAWWVGQFLKYIFRSRNTVDNLVEEITNGSEIKKPYVGVHIRRTRQNMGMIQPYMAEVEEYYETLELTQEVPVRRIFLATDNRGIISEMNKQYGNRYQIVWNVQARYPYFYDTRYDSESLRGLMYDMLFLSLSDYLVCTFSSHLCRAVYEIMQAFHADASGRAYSLQRKYYYECELDENLTAVYPHRSRNPREINFDLGDEVTEVRDLNNGFSFGINRRSKEAGLFPSFKVDEILKTFDFPTYPDITVKKKLEK